jgi:hypothetical protein
VAVISAVTLFANDKEPWWQIFAIFSVICGFTFRLYFHKMEEFFDELEEMYAPKEKIRKRTKKERKGRALIAQKTKPISTQRQSKRYDSRSR